MLRYLEIKEEVKKIIATMPHNAKLMSRPLLTKKLDTSRATLDKAIAELIEEGFLEAKGGSGTYVVGQYAKDRGSWGVIIPSIAEEVYPAMVLGIENIAQGYGINLILCNSDNNADKQGEYIDRLLRTGVSGIIMVPVITNDPSVNCILNDQLSKINVPIVFCNRMLSGISASMVTSNNFYGGYLAANHLLRQGYRQPAYIAHKEYATSLERLQGFLAAMAENGLAMQNKRIVLHCEESTDDLAYKEMKRQLDTDTSIDSVFCFNDYIARGVYKAIKDHGLSIAADIGVIGYNNEKLCDTMEPKLTSISFKNMEIGQQAARTLWKLVQGEPQEECRYFFFQPELIVRESCTGPRK
jgi:DNA-binding LacI/PurR family transcriptional regulator